MRYYIFWLTEMINVEILGMFLHILITIPFLSFSAKKRTSPDAKSINYKHDQDGRILKTIDGNGNEILMVYADNAGITCSVCQYYS